MVNRKCLLFIFLVFLFVFNPINLFAQKNDSQNEQLSDDEIENVEETWQILEWEEEDPDFVLNFEIVIEEYNKSSYEWSEVRRIETKDNSTSYKIEPQLPSGIYRYKIITYNLIQLPVAESEYFDLVIQRAYQPQVREFNVKSSLTSTIYLDEINDGIFKVEGINLFSPNLDDEKHTTYVLRSFFNTVLPLEVNSELKNEARSTYELDVHFDMNDIDVGSYHFIATDASGLRSNKDSSSLLTVKFKKRFDFDVSGGYALPVEMSDDKDNALSNYFKSPVFPFSAAAKTSFMFSKHKYGYLGLGLEAFYTRMYKPNLNIEKENYVLDGNLIQGFVNAIYQFPIRKKTGKDKSKTKLVSMLELHGGVGLSFINDLKFTFEVAGHNIYSTPVNYMFISFDIGGTAQYYLTNRWFIEANADVIISPFMRKNGLVMFIPSVCMGWQF